MSTIYIVTSGEYEDYSVEAPFSTREKAQAYIDRFKEHLTEPEIEEYTIDPEWLDGATNWQVIMTVDGQTVVAQQHAGVPHGGHGRPFDIGEPNIGWAMHDPFKNKMTAGWPYLVATSKADAISQCRVKRQELVVLGRWDELKRSAEGHR